MGINAHFHCQQAIAGLSVLEHNSIRFRFGGQCNVVPPCTALTYVKGVSGTMSAGRRLNRSPLFIGVGHMPLDNHQFITRRQAHSGDGNPKVAGLRRAELRLRQLGR